MTFRDILPKLGLGRKKIKIEISCPHGEFIPGAYLPGSTPSKYACGNCMVMVKISTFKGPIYW